MNWERPTPRVDKPKHPGLKSDGSSGAKFLSFIPKERKVTFFRRREPFMFRAVWGMFERRIETLGNNTYLKD